MVRQAVAWNPQTPEEVLRGLAQENDEGIRRDVASNLRTPITTLASLSDDASWEVRRSVAMHPHLPVARRTALHYDPHPDVRQRAKAASTFWTSFGIRPSDDEWKRVRTWLEQPPGRVWKLEGRPLREWESMEEQLMNISEEVRQAMKTIKTAQLLHWDESTIWPNEHVRQQERIEKINSEKTASLLLQSDFPLQALNRFSQSSHWEVRYLVALHEGTPLSARQALSHDGNRYVRAAARLRAT